MMMQILNDGFRNMIVMPSFVHLSIFKHSYMTCRIESDRMQESPAKVLAAVRKTG